MTKEIILISIVLLAVMVTLAGILYYTLFYRRHIYREIAQSAPISNKWTVFHLDPPMQSEKRFQDIVLVIPGARFDLNSDDGFLLDANVIQPEVEVAEADGIWRALPLRGGRISPSGNDSASETIRVSGVSFRLPKAAKKGFASLRIRSEKAFSCSKIRGHAYYVK